MMTVYVCMATRAECDLADRCMIRRAAPEDEVHVCYFKSDRRGEFCPHFLPTPKDSRDAPQP